MSYIVFDTETTSLLSLEAAGQEAQPEIIELAAIRMDESFAITNIFHTRCKPRGNIHVNASRVHGITNEDLKDEKPFVTYYRQLAEFFLGAKYFVGHNSMFDKSVLAWELQRIHKHYNFPWPMFDICTMTTLEQMKGYRLSLANAYVEMLGETFVDAHSALADCQATARLFVRMWERKYINDQ